MRRILSTAAAIMALALMVPTIGHAEVVQPDCMFDRVDGVGAPAPLQVSDSCTVEFELTAAEQAFHVSLLDSHAGLHAFPDNGVYGELSLVWRDEDGALVAEYACRSLALRGDGEDHRTLKPACSEVTAAPETLPVGISTLTATLTSTTNPGARKARIHGRLVLRGDDLP